MIKHMKKHSTLVAAGLLACIAAWGQDIRCVQSLPGESADRQMRISWSTDTTAAESHVVYTKANDRNWRKAKVVKPEECRRCDLFEETGGGVIVKCGASLEGLRPDTEYKYCIESGAERSAEHSFRTAGAGKWSACVISDMHTYMVPGRTLAAMAMIDTVRALDPSLDFVLSPGDVVAFSDYYSVWSKLFEQRHFQDLMWARVNGNHDNWTKDCPRELRYEVPNHYYTATSYFPHNGYEGEIGVCYHFRYGNAFFVMLNTEDMAGGKELDDAKAWTRRVIAEARAGKNPPTFVVVCFHYEWFYGQDGRAFQYKRWSELFDEMGVDLALAGDNHIYVRSHPIRGGVVVGPGAGGTTYLQTPASDNDRGREVNPDRNDNPDFIACRWSEGPHTVGAVHMQVNGKNMKLKLYNRHGEVVDECEIRK